MMPPHRLRLGDVLHMILVLHIQQLLARLVIAAAVVTLRDPQRKMKQLQNLQTCRLASWLRPL